MGKEWSEEGIIEKYLTKLTNGNKLALGLKDDIAKLDDFTIIKTDTTIEGVHILEGLPANFVAFKAMARCVSDVFAKNGNVLGYLTNIILPKGFVNFTDLFAGFAQFASLYKMNLIGGDLSTHNAKNIVIVITVVAKVEKDLPRFNAKIGDGLYLTKEIGGAYLGFCDVKNGNFETKNAGEYLTPSIAKIGNLAGINASMDISDGLIQDAKKMAKASNACFEIDYNCLPFVRNNNACNVAKHKEMLAFADDYNALISSSMPVKNAKKIGVVKQGGVKTDGGLQLLNFPFEIENSGFDHFNK